jgi:hypothetical protein
MQDFVGLLSRQKRQNTSQIVFVERREGATLVRVDDKLIPPHVARALEHWLEEVLPQLQAASSVFDTNASRPAKFSANASSRATLARETPGRRLLLFRELALAVEQRVRSGWSEAGRLHEAFSQSVSLMLTYDYTEVAAHEWPPMASGPDTCNELHELLMICIETAEGIFDGWLTLTHERDRLQARPTDSLHDAWPVLLRPQGEDAVPSETFSLDADNSDDDFLTQTCTEATGAVLRALHVEPRVVYDLFYSVTSAANASFTCPYHAVQTCSGWRRRLWQVLVIVVVWFSAATLLTNAVGLSFVSSLLVPLFSLVTLQLCYGYTWTCAPMIPVCAWQDFTESVDAFLPLSLEIPEELKKIDADCLQPRKNCDTPEDLNSCLDLQRYPPARCLKRCRDAPFAFTAWTDVVAWALAEAGPWATDFATANVDTLPFVNHDDFKTNLNTRIRTMQRTSADSVRAHRVCAILSAYMLVPYVVLVLLVLAFVASLAQALAAQLFPIFVVVCTLFNAVTVSANTEDEERLQALEKTVLQLQEQNTDEEESEEA